VPTVAGRVTMTVPPIRTAPCCGCCRGVPAHASNRPRPVRHLKAVIGPNQDAALESFLKDWAPAIRYDPRKSMVSS